ncbi:hypothetical protein PROH_07595 [Prochlorothrix hollandica PCC 9006 = CALU 1027]|uniref:Uncharacterized protein n=1 Tax=Prochlorothrix hollandica PCC 9006 = CALU 1027 TaxID=317619 RepID=A0A0M2PT74_PROHO|nr:hypothetical protein PROH_07595 [Prochlorothrix hollandica PCC 9006 = CALU 1027]
MSIWVTGFEPIASSYFTSINFKISSFKVNGYNFALITQFHLRTYLILVNAIATLGKFFFAIAGLTECHDC